MVFFSRVADTFSFFLLTTFEIVHAAIGEPRPLTYAHCGNTFEWPTDGVANEFPPGPKQKFVGE